MAPTHVFVTPAEGREVPVHPSHASAAGGGLLKCQPGKVYRLPYVTETRKRINAGDLILCDRDGGDVEELADAEAPEDVEIAVDGSVAPLPPPARFDTSDVKKGT